ncbi:MAG: hypothetical protein COB53_10760, partial [Elusimicrobia bacterium]
WEIRGAGRHFVYSKVLCWTAFDRAIKLSSRFGWEKRAEIWRQERRSLRKEILKRGYDAERGCFLQAFGHRDLDASTLKIGMLGFVRTTDPRFMGTIRAIEKELGVGGMIYRYKGQENLIDGLPGEEGTFTMCSFWHVQALARAGRKDEATKVFRRLLKRSGPLGLYSEQLASDGTALGNYPQAFTHLSLVQAALALLMV